MIKIVSAVLLLMLSFHAIGSNVGKYDHSKGTAIFVLGIPKANMSSLLEVDFENELVDEIARSRFHNHISSNGHELIAYNQYGSFEIFNVTTKTVIYSELSELGKYGTYRWSDEGYQLAVFNRKKQRAVEFVIDKETNGVTKVEFSTKVDVHASWIVWVEWNALANKFLYQFGSDDEQKKIYAYTDQKLKLIPDHQRIDLQDGDKYFEIYSEEEIGHFIDFYDSNGKIAAFESRLIIPNYGFNLMRVGSSLKILNSGGPIIDLRSNTLAFPTNALKPLDGPKKITYPDEAFFIDLAKDDEGYVLQWNRKQNLFQVLDVRNAKIVKRHEKFW